MNSDNKINIGDSFKSIASIQLNVGDNWKDVSEAYINIGNSWKQFWATVTSGSRGIFAGGNDGTYDIIDYITLNSTGNATDFGDLTTGTGAGLGGVSNGDNDRGVFGGGYTSSGYTDIMSYITISTTGNASSFGDLGFPHDWIGGNSNNTNERGVFNGGYNGVDQRTIVYITINSTGDATSFGDLTGQRRAVGSTSNGTNERGINMGGLQPTHTRVNIIDYITINSIGNATDFGDMSIAMNGSACSNLTNERAVLSCIKTTANTTLIEYITINSLGNSTDFGDSTQARSNASATSSGESERGVFAGGTASSDSNVIDYITINSTGNAADFGDLSQARNGLCGLSDA